MWATDPARQPAFARALEALLRDAEGRVAANFEVLRSADGGRVIVLARAHLQADVAMLRARAIAASLTRLVDMRGVRPFEAHTLQTVAQGSADG
jgi:hypothetical protein